MAIKILNKRKIKQQDMEEKGVMLLHQNCPLSERFWLSSVVFPILQAAQIKAEDAGSPARSVSMLECSAVFLEQA